ncbi:MAG: AraC family transcriptional regulator [Lachnospiraceae bacterium]|nr:AraC family transcriptional regulator [Lachnospiraceae bacterium]
MKIIKMIMQHDANSSRNCTGSTNGKQSLMLKMVSSYSVFLFIILVLCVHLYVSDTKAARSQYQWQVQATLMSNAELLEKDIDIMNTYCRQLLQDGRFRTIAKKTEVDNALLVFGNVFASSVASDVYPPMLLPMSEVYCYFPNSDFVLGTGYFVEQNRFYHRIKGYPAEVHETFMKILTSPSEYYHFIPMSAFLPRSGKNFYMYVIDMEELSYINIDAVTYFVLEEEKLFSIFECLNTDSPYRYLSVWTNQTDNILSFSTQEGAHFDRMIADGQFSQVEDFLQSNGMSINCYTSPDTGYTYYYSYPSYESTTNNAPPQILYAALFAAALVGGLILIFMLSASNIRPIIELDQQLQVTEQEKSHLQEVMDSQRPIVFNSYVRQFLKGMIVSPEEASYAKAFLGLTADSLTYNGLYVIAYTSANDYQSSVSEYLSPEQCGEIVLDALRQYIGNPLYCFSPSARAYALIVVGRPQDEQELILKTNESVVKLHNYLLDTYGIWLFAGIGKNTSDILNVWESYQQAREAVNYTSKNYIFFPYEFIKKDSSAFYYPNELSTKLIHFITTGNTPQVMELFNLLHQENIEERSLPINMVQFLLSDIRNTLLKARFALPQNTPAEVQSSLDETFNQHVSFKLCEDIALRLCELFTVQPEHSDLIAAIEQYIHDNYSDPSMGLTKISDEFQISESYFSHLFKEKKGVNFSTYLENMRMNEASRLIRETDTSLNELYLYVGYNNANTFRRAFKKVYGMTPSAMRDG